MMIDDWNHITLIDFGNAMVASKTDWYRGLLTTDYYASPRARHGLSYSPHANDVWYITINIFNLGH